MRSNHQPLVTIVHIPAHRSARTRSSDQQFSHLFNDPHPGFRHKPQPAPLRYFQRIITCILLILVTACSANAQSGAYTINGRLSGTTGYYKAKLYKSFDAGQKPDSVEIVNGNFSFKGTVDYPVKAFMVFYIKDSTAPEGFNYANTYVYLEPGVITIEDPDTRIHVRGSALNDDNEKTGALTRPIDDRSRAVYKSLQSATPEQKKDTAFMAGIERQQTALFKEREMALNRFITANPGRLLSFFLLEEQYHRMDTPDPDSFIAELNGLSPAVQASPQAKEFVTMLHQQKVTMIGNMAPDFTQTDTAGKPVSLHDFRGKYVLVDFWASWCHPCRDENPNVVKAYNAFKNKNFTVLSVSFDQPGQKDQWMKAIHDDHLTWTHVSDLKFWDNEAGKRYAIQSIPQNFLIDPQGKIIARDLRGEALEKKLTELLGG